MSLLLAGLLLAAPAADCTEPPDLGNAENTLAAPVEASGTGLWIAGVRFRGDDIVAAAVDKDPVTSTWAVDLRLSRTGKNKFDAIQRCRVNRMVEISLDGTALARPNLAERIDGPIVRIAGNFSLMNATDYAERISTFR